MGKKPNDLAQKFVKEKMQPVPAVGSPISRADLEQRIKDAKDQCADYIHFENWTVSRANARGVCSSYIDAAYKEEEEYSIANSYNQDQKVTQLALQGNKKLYGIVAIVLLTLVGIALLLRNK